MMVEMKGRKRDVKEGGEEQMGTYMGVSVSVHVSLHTCIHGYNTLVPVSVNVGLHEYE